MSQYCNNVANNGDECRVTACTRFCFCKSGPIHIMHYRMIKN